MRAHYDEFVTTAAQQQWDHLPMFARLLAGEVARRRDRAIAQHIRLTRFPVMKALYAFDWIRPKELNRQQVMNVLRLQFIQPASNVIFIGGAGLGKSPGHRARPACVRKRHSVLFASAVDVVNTAGRVKHDLNLSAVAYLGFRAAPF